MILHGNQRGSARELALHLLKDENDHVVIHEIRGFVSDDVVSALDEARAISKGTKAKQYLYSLSLNPPANVQVSTETFEEAITRVEDKLGLTGQPRVVVFHEKEGLDGQQRRHCHAVWSRIDTEHMKAIHLPYTKYKLQEISKELYIEHGWKMPNGFIDKAQRDAKNFTLAEWQQAKRNQKNPKHIKAAMQSSWAESHDQQTLQKALAERGYTLAKGGRRGFVAIDQQCEPYALPKWIGVKTKDVRNRVNQPEKLPSFDEAKGQIAKDMQKRLTELKDEQAQKIADRQAKIREQRQELINRQTEQRAQLQAEQQKRWAEEIQTRQARFNTGLRGVLDHVTGKHKRIKQQNEIETLKAYQRDQKQRDELLFQQQRERQGSQLRMQRLEAFKKEKHEVITREIKEINRYVDGDRSLRM